MRILNHKSTHWKNIKACIYSFRIYRVFYITGGSILKNCTKFNWPEFDALSEICEWNGCIKKKYSKGDTYTIVSQLYLTYEYKLEYLNMAKLWWNHWECHSRDPKKY